MCSRTSQVQPQNERGKAYGYKKMKGIYVWLWLNSVFSEAVYVQKKKEIIKLIIIKEKIIESGHKRYV